MSPFVEEWPPARFDSELRARERVLVLFDAPRSRFAKVFEAAEADAPVPFARAALAAKDARRSRYGIDVTPTLVYFEHGEELERVDGVPKSGLTRADLEELLETIASIQEEPMLPKRMHGPRRF